MAEPTKIRVMIVDDIADTREYIRRSLQFDNLIEVVGLARSGTEAIQMTLDQKPDVIIMDINMPDMDGITATEAVRRKSPYTQVIILSVQNDPSYMRRAMLVGARDFLTKPPSIDELLAAIRRAGKVAEEEKGKLTQQATAIQNTAQAHAGKTQSQQGKIIIVYSPKGGTGRTTTAVNLSLALISDDKKVVLVDGGMQFGDVAVFLNEQVKNSIIDLTNSADDLDVEMIESVLTKHNAKINENLKQEVVLSIPFDEKVAINAVNRGIPFLIDNRTQPISKAILSLAETVKDRIQKNETPSA